MDINEEKARLDPLAVLDQVDTKGFLDLNSFLEKKTISQAGTKRKRSAKNLDRVPVFKYASLPSDDNLESLYSSFRVLHLSPSVGKSFPGDFTWKSLLSLFAALDSDADSWCVETGNKKESSVSVPTEFLQPNITKSQGYCSFMLQNDTSVWESTLPKLPVQKIASWFHSPCIWFFFGRNHTTSNDKNSLKGREEHTDSVSHDGTWHFQLSGTKRWFLRPTKELVDILERNGMEVDTNKKIQVNCNEGDIFILNTRLWWHQTEIPSQESPSVSYARDFHFASKPNCEATPMSNVDGLYAANDIEEGTIIFREDEMPDCALHRSSNPNCSVVVLDDETHAIISVRKINAGEFFCVGDSDDESGESCDGDSVDSEDGQ